METESGYLAISQLENDELTIAGDTSNVKLADEPTNIMWEGHERGIEQVKFHQVAKMFLGFFVCISFTIVLNYAVSVYRFMLSHQYESRCFGDTVSDTHWRE